MTNLKFKKMKNIIKYVQSECEILEIILFDLQLLSYLMLNLDSTLYINTKYTLPTGLSLLQFVKVVKTS